MDSTLSSLFQQIDSAFEKSWEKQSPAKAAGDEPTTEEEGRREQKSSSSHSLLTTLDEQLRNEINLKVNSNQFCKMKWNQPQGEI